MSSRYKYSCPETTKEKTKKTPDTNQPTENTEQPAKGNDMELFSSLHIERPLIIGHDCIQIGLIPEEWVEKAIEDFSIAYGHSSHGSQVTDGMLGLTDFKGNPFIYRSQKTSDSLDLRDRPFNGAEDLGNPDNKVWASATRQYLKQNRDINVVMWSWCGQLSGASFGYVDTYLELMNSLEEEFSDVVFVYMTGHLDGSGPEEKLAKNNDRIRQYCIDNNKVLFDFADIESYNPDGEYFGDRYANDGCEYDSNNDKKLDRNWAIDWQSVHREGLDWYDCKAAHTQPINANMKAYAAWWLFARLAGWDGKQSSVDADDYMYYANKLSSINFFRGTGEGFELDRTPTRFEGSVMLTRLLGGEKEAFDNKYPHPFTDAQNTWASPYVGYLYRYSFTKGISDTLFGDGIMLNQNTYITYLLRILGYSDEPPVSDFVWSGALEMARSMNIIDENFFCTLRDMDFNRGHMARLTYLFLSQKLKSREKTLLEKLVDDGAVNKSAADELEF
jgi:hypothetical protein